MRSFGLTPNEVLARVPAGEIKVGASLVFCMGYGALSVAAVSLLGYSIYAYGLIANPGLMYTAIAGVYVVLSGVILSRLVAGHGALPRFALLFAASFVLYAVAWCALWFGLKGRHHADIWGSALGLAAMTAMIRAAFGHRGGFLPLFAVLFSFHTLGFYLGEVLHDFVAGPNGKLLWGVGHGLGFGAGLGYVLHACQSALRTQLHQDRQPASA